MWVRERTHIHNFIYTHNCKKKNTHTLYTCLREGRKKEASKVKQTTRQSNKAHPRMMVGLKPTTLYTLYRQSALKLSYMYIYQGSSAGWVQLYMYYIHVHCFPSAATTTRFTCTCTCIHVQLLVHSRICVASNIHVRTVYVHVFK